MIEVNAKKEIEGTKLIYRTEVNNALHLLVNEVDDRILYDNFQLNQILLLKTFYF